MDSTLEPYLMAAGFVIATMITVITVVALPAFFLPLLIAGLVARSDL